MGRLVDGGLGVVYEKVTTTTLMMVMMLLSSSGTGQVLAKMIVGCWLLVAVVFIRPVSSQCQPPDPIENGRFYYVNDNQTLPSRDDGGKIAANALFAVQCLPGFQYKNKTDGQLFGRRIIFSCLGDSFQIYPPPNQTICGKPILICFY